jgi:anti-sigma B factor antagonist
VSEEPVTSLDRDADVVTVRLHGEIDVVNVDRVRVTLMEALESRPGTIVVDLAKLSFIDSTGLGAIIYGFQRARDQGVGFELAHPSRGVRQILVLSGVLEVVTLTE